MGKLRVVTNPLADSSRNRSENRWRSHHHGGAGGSALFHGGRTDSYRPTYRSLSSDIATTSTSSAREAALGESSSRHKRTPLQTHAKDELTLLNEYLQRLNNGEIFSEEEEEDDQIPAGQATISSEPGHNRNSFCATTTTQDTSLFPTIPLCMRVGDTENDYIHDLSDQETLDAYDAWAVSTPSPEVTTHKNLCNPTVLSSVLNAVKTRHCNNQTSLVELKTNCDRNFKRSSSCFGGFKICFTVNKYKDTARAGGRIFIHSLIPD